MSFPPVMNLTGPAIPPPPGVVPNFEHPYSRAHEVISAVVACTAIAGSFVLMRLWTKVMITRQLWWDDFTCVLSLVFIIVTGLAAQTTKGGVGIHLWDIPLGIWLTKDYEQFYIWNVVGDVGYVLAMGFIKLSILLLYIKLLAPGMKLRFAIYSIMAFVAASMIAFTFSLAFGCRPLAKLYHPLMPGYCIDVLKQAFWQGIVNVLSDVMVLAIPIPMVWPMQMPLKHKLGVIGIFSTGSTVLGFSLWRLVCVKGGESTTDPTWAAIIVGISSMLEVNLAIIASCMPAFKPFVRHYLNFLHSRTSSSGSSYSSPSFPANHSPSSSGDLEKAYAPQQSASKRGSVVPITSALSDDYLPRRQ